MALTAAIKTQISDWYQRFQREWPDFISRTPQRQMIAEVANAFAGEIGRHLVIEAPTGIGKTLSYLLPGIAVAKAENKTLIVSTANVALQDQILDKDLPLLKQIIPSLSYCVLFGRNRYVCPRNLYLIGDSDGRQPDLLWLLDDSHQLANDDRPNKNQQNQCERLETKLNTAEWDGVRDHSEEFIDDALWQRLSTDKARCLAHHCQWFQSCPYYLSRQQVAQVDVTVTNHALLIKALENESVLPPVKSLLVVLDEGHHLPGIARDSLEQSADISTESCSLQLSNFMQLLSNMTEKINFKAPPLFKNLNALDKHCATIIDHHQAIGIAFKCYLQLNPSTESYRFPLGELPDTLVDMARQLMLKYETLRSNSETLLNALGELTGKIDMLILHQAMLQLNRFLVFFETQTALWRLGSTSLLSGAPVSKWLTQGKQTPLWFHCAGIRVSEQLEAILWKKVAHIVVTSATLQSLNSFQRFQELSGLSQLKDDRFVALDSPFNHAKQGKLVIPKMMTEPYFINEQTHLSEMAAIFRVSIAKTPVLGVLVLFASLRAMQFFLTKMSDMRQQLLVQGDHPRRQLIKLHQERIAKGEKSILLGLQSFSEGLDLKGKLLSQVHIQKLAFPPVDSPLIITESEWLQQQKRYPFEIQSLPSASFTLIQQVGRLIRSHHCFGEIIIYDRRLLTKSYGRRLLSALPAFPIEQSNISE